MRPPPSEGREDAATSAQEVRSRPDREKQVSKRPEAATMDKHSVVSGCDGAGGRRGHLRERRWGHALKSDRGVAALGGSCIRDCVKGTQKDRGAPGEVTWWAVRTQPNTKGFK